MANTIVWSVVLLTALFVFQALFRLALQSRRPQNFPAGPPTLPIIGNLHVIPTTKAFAKFHEWGKQYGTMIGLKLGSQNMVVLNDYKHVLDLFDRRGAIYSNRPPSYIANELIFQHETHILFLPYGDAWRRLRKTLQDLLRNSEVDKMIPIQTAESTQTLYDILTEPDKWYNHIRRYSTAVILASVFGLRGPTFDSPRVKALYHVQDQNTAINELGATPPIDIFPFLKSLPAFMSPWRKWANDIRVEYQALLQLLVRESKENAAQPGAPDCFFIKMLQARDKSGLDEHHVAHLGTTLMEAGSDTTASTLLSFLLAMATHPEALRKCQEEIDAVCGEARSPTIEDTTNLTYLRATLEETLRWRPVAAGGIPHTLSQDDWYEGYFFPKGTLFLANAWSIHRSDEFADPDAFQPERWLHSKFGTKAGHVDDEDKRRIHYGFGAGRRVCSGQRLAENSMIIIMAKLVWAFDFQAQEADIDTNVDTGFFGGFIICPKPFPLRMVPRSDRHKATIEAEMEDARPFLSKFKE